MNHYTSEGRNELRVKDTVRPPPLPAEGTDAQSLRARATQLRIQATRFQEAARELDEIAARLPKVAW